MTAPDLCKWRQGCDQRAVGGIIVERSGRELAARRRYCRRHLALFVDTVPWRDRTQYVVLYDTHEADGP